MAVPEVSCQLIAIHTQYVHACNNHYSDMYIYMEDFLPDVNLFVAFK